MRVLGVLLIVLVACIVLGLLIYGAQETVKWARVRRKRKADREVPWTYYCRPERPHGRPVVYRIGVERRTEDNRVLSDVHIRDVPIGDELERQVVEEEAKLRARSYNDSKVGM